MPVTVYWLKHLSGEDYVGSTEVGTVARWKRYKSEKPHKMHIFLKQHNYEGFTTITLEVASGCTKPERWMMEQYWIDKLRPSLNEINAYTSREQRKLRATEMIDCACGARFQRTAKARHKSTAMHKRYMAGYVQPTRNRRNGHEYCRCGQRYARSNKSAHLKCDRHKRRMAALEK